MNWTKLSSLEELEQLKEASKAQKILIFKHSTRCNISAMALNRLERSWKTEEMQGVTPYYLDLISYREVSNQIATTFQVTHQSPQVLLIEQGQCVYHASHMEIAYPHLQQMIAPSLNK
jgi:bacillithiol system protein YtxJ